MFYPRQGKVNNTQQNIQQMRKRYLIRCETFFFNYSVSVYYVKHKRKFVFLLLPNKIVCLSPGQRRNVNKHLLPEEQSSQDSRLAY